MGERDPALARLVEAGDAVEHRGLAGAVRPDDGGDVAAVRREGQVVHRDEAAESHGEVLEAQQHAHPWPSGTSAPEIALRATRCTEAWRVEISPRGRTTMISTMAKPNSSMRYWVGSKSLPNTCLSTSSSRSASVPPIMATAATATPIWLPMPPSTTMARMVADSMKVKDSGEMKPCRAAKKAPAKPPKPAPIANAVSLVLVVLMPSERHAISSSRSASQARPTGRRRSRTVTKAVRNTSARMM